MKKILVMVMVTVLAGIFTTQAQNGKEKVKKIYSLPQYDGTHHQGQQTSLTSFKGGLYVAHGIGVKSYSWVTFDLKGIDLTKAKRIKLWLYETENHNGKNPNKEITLHTAFVEVPADDYPHWVGSYKPKFTWPKKGRELNRQRSNKHWLISDNLLPELREFAKDQPYLTLAIIVNPGWGWAGTIGFADGSPQNGLLRPYLEITY